MGQFLKIQVSYGLTNFNVRWLVNIDIKSYYGYGYLPRPNPGLGPDGYKNSITGQRPRYWPNIHDMTNEYSGIKPNLINDMCIKTKERIRDK